MPGRHTSPYEPGGPSRPSWPRRLGVFVLAVVVIAAAAVAVRAFVASGGDDGCGTTVQDVDVAADPSISDPVAEAAAAFATPDRCVNVNVTAQEPSETLSEITGSGGVDLWIPDSTMWRSELPDPNLVNSIGSIASTPLVAVAPRTVAEEQLGWPAAEFSWTAALQSEPGAAIADPEASTEGLMTLMAVRGALGDTVDQVQAVGAMTKVARNVVPSTEDAFATVGTEEGPAVFTATEQAVVAHNRSNPDVPVVALYPSEGTLTLNYPALVVADSTVYEAAVEFADYLTRQQDSTLAAGFRDGNDELRAGQDVGVLSRPPRLLETPSAEAIQAIAQQWDALSLDMRMLAVVDVSGSMDDVVNEDGVTRIEQSRDAAQTALALLPDSSSVGLWAFSTPEDQENDDPYTELVEVGALTDDVGGATREEALHAAAETLPDRVDAGGTALYDTALAAFRKMFAGYEEGRINSVVMMTDGENEDYPESIDLETLLDALGAQYDPAKPVALIMIGIGEDVDMETLQQISQATGSTAYHAERPDEIEQIFIKAMIERQCRPNC